MAFLKIRIDDRIRMRYKRSQLEVGTEVIFSATRSRIYGDPGSFRLLSEETSSPPVTTGSSSSVQELEAAAGMAEEKTKMGQQDSRNNKSKEGKSLGKSPSSKDEPNRTFTQMRLGKHAHFGSRSTQNTMKSNPQIADFNPKQQLVSIRVSI